MIVLSFVNDFSLYVIWHKVCVRVHCSKSRVYCFVSVITIINAPFSANRKSNNDFHVIHIFAEKYANFYINIICLLRSAVILVLVASTFNTTTHRDFRHMGKHAPRCDTRP